MIPVISLQNVSCFYKDYSVLKDISLDLPQGAFAGIVGPSGAGKTTLLKALLGLVKVKGTIEVFGQKITEGISHTIGYVPQLETVDWNFPITVEQVVLMGLHDQGCLYPWYNDAQKLAVERLLKELDIAQYKNTHIRELSGGQQQRVFLARALIRKPKLLLLDEPTNGIDIKNRHTLLHLLEHLNKQGITILLTTHDLNAVAAHLPWIICFNKRLIAQGAPETIFTSHILSETYDAPLDVIHHVGVLPHLPFVMEKEETP